MQFFEGLRNKIKLINKRMEDYQEAITFCQAGIIMKIGGKR